MSGIVYLVGAGPGDPGLITRRGADALRSAEVIVYDHLASDRLLELAPDHAERIGVRAEESRRQRRGAQVLIGGASRRRGEEIDALDDAAAGKPLLRGVRAAGGRLTAQLS